jgi:hypothetical protein
MTKKKAKPKAAKQKHEATERERAALRNIVERNAAAPAPRLKVLHEETLRIFPDHPVEIVGGALLMEALGTTSFDFYDGLIGQLANASLRAGKVNERDLNFMLSIVKGIKPKDEIEAMLAAQMALVHVAMVAAARNLAHAELIPQQDSGERTVNKLARTFATQMEALKRYRTGGEQKVTVQHVSVSEGGQAIVGNFTQPPQESPAPHPAAAPLALTDAKLSPMPILNEPARTAVPAKRKERK